MRSFFKFLSRNKLYTFIETFGLSVALGFVILLSSYARTEFNVGTKQPLSKQLYAVGAGEFFGMTLGTADEFFPSIPEIKEWTNLVHVGDSHIKSGEDYFPATEAAADTNFFKLLKYRLTGCTPEYALKNMDEAILSESFAKRMFGGEDPVGRTIDVNGSPLRVIGTVQDFGPEDPFTHYDIFTCIKRQEKSLARMDNFGSTLPLVLLKEGSDPEKVRETLLDKFSSYWDFYQKDGNSKSFLWGATLTRFDRIYFSDLEPQGSLRKGDRKQVEILLAVALVLLFCAIFNYINLTVAQTGKRAKEMATRRLLGESDARITGRYITESFSFTLACFIAGCVLAWVFRPFFARILSSDIQFSFNAGTILWTVPALVAVSVISAMIPAAMVSRFKPIDVVKGEFRFRSKMVFSKVFIVLQGVFSTVLIAMAITMTAQIKHLADLPAGYNTADIIQIHSNQLGYSSAVQTELQSRIKTLPQVTDAGLGINTPLNCGANGLHDADGQLTGWMRLCQLDTTSLRILGFKLTEQYSALSSDKILLTETAKRELGVSEEHPYAGGSASKPENEICGIVQDFRTRDALFTPMEGEYNSIKILSDDYPYIFTQIIKISGDRKEALAAVKGVCKEFAVEKLGIPMDIPMYYIDERLQESLTGTRNTMLLVLSFMVIAILISSMGLFAMALYFAEQQGREIAVRKVYGADTGTATWTLVKPFMTLCLVSAVIATPISFKMIDRYLQGFYNKIDFPWWAMVLAVLVTLVISLLSVLSQSWKTATLNPVKTLGQD